MLLMGFPVDEMDTSVCSQREPCLNQVQSKSICGLSTPLLTTVYYYVLKIWTYVCGTKELHDLAGNAMSTRAVLAAFCAALKATLPSKIQSILDRTWNGLTLTECKKTLMKRLLTSYVCATIIFTCCIGIKIQNTVRRSVSPVSVLLSRNCDNACISTGCHRPVTDPNLVPALFQICYFLHDSIWPCCNAATEMGFRW